jgi:hypothetical protein
MTARSNNSTFSGLPDIPGVQRLVQECNDQHNEEPGEQSNEQLDGQSHPEQSNLERRQLGSGIEMENIHFHIWTTGSDRQVLVSADAEKLKTYAKWLLDEKYLINVAGRICSADNLTDALNQARITVVNCYREHDRISQEKINKA